MSPFSFANSRWILFLSVFSWISLWHLVSLFSSLKEGSVVFSFSSNFPTRYFFLYVDRFRVFSVFYISPKNIFLFSHLYYLISYPFSLISYWFTFNRNKEIIVLKNQMKFLFGFLEFLYYPSLYSFFKLTQKLIHTDLNGSSVCNFMQLLRIKPEVSHQEVDHASPQRVLFLCLFLRKFLHPWMMDIVISNT